MKINNIMKCGCGLAVVAGLTYTACQKLNKNKQQDVQINKQEYRLKTPEELQRIVPDKRIIDTSTVAIDTIYDVPMDCYIPDGKTIRYTKDAKGQIRQIIRVVRNLK